MENPIISIIVPIYNREKLILRLAESIVPQLSEEVELVLVDDGSTDGSLQVCYEIAKQSTFIQVLHKENGGVSSARNFGIKNAKGVYLAFVDSDDMMEQGSFAKLLKVVKQYSPDMLDFGWKYISRNGEITENLHQLPKNVILDQRFIKEVVIPPLINIKEDRANHIYPFSCTKIVKREILINNGVYLDETRKVWEDQPFIVSYLRYVKSLYCLDDWLYCYMDTPGSLSRTYTTTFFDIIIKNYRLYKSLFENEYDFDTQYVYDYWCNAIVNMIFRSFEETDAKEEIEKVIKETLSNPQVVSWFEKATRNDKLEKKISSKIVLGDVENAVLLFKKKYRQEQKAEKLKQCKARFKSLVKKLFGKGA